MVIMGSDERDPLAHLGEDELRALIRTLAARVPEVQAFLKTLHTETSAGLAELRIAIEEDLAPRSRGYNYSQANHYAFDAEDTVQVVCALAEEATPEVIPVIERALTLSTRAILRSDDSSGLQGDQIHQLLQAHATAVRECDPRLSAKEQRRVVDWIIKYRYGGEQDFFDPDIVAYAPGLDAAAIDRYRAEIGRQDLGEYGGYPLRRLAVLDRDPRAILAAHKVPHNAFMAMRLVEDLREAGLQEDAIHFARLGLTLPSADRAPQLVDYLVEVAIDDGDPAGALDLRRSWHEQYGTWESFHGLQSTARSMGAWAEEQTAAEEVFREKRPKLFLRVSA